MHVNHRIYIYRSVATLCRCVYIYICIGAGVYIKCAYDILCDRCKHHSSFIYTQGQDVPAPLLRASGFMHTVVSKLVELVADRPELSQSVLFETHIYVGSFFSGMGALESAVDCINAALTRARNDGTFQCDAVFEQAFACDSNAACQKYLNKCTTGCMFKDILHLLPDQTLAKVKETEAVSTEPYDNIVRAIWGTPTRTHKIPCASHLLLACCIPPVMLEWAGSPCPDYSRRGGITSTKPRGKQGQDAKLLITWAKHIADTEPPCAGHENVIGFDTDILDTLLGPKYNIVHMRVGPGDVFGDGVASRQRVISILVHKEKACIIGDIEATYKTLSKSVVASVGQLLWMYINIYIYIYTYLYLVHLWVRWTYIYTYIYMYIYVYVYVYIYRERDIYIYIHIYSY